MAKKRKEDAEAVLAALRARNRDRVRACRARKKRKEAKRIALLGPKKLTAIERRKQERKEQLEVMRFKEKQDRQAERELLRGDGLGNPET